MAQEHAFHYGATVSFVYRSALRGYAATIPDRALAAIHADPAVLSVEPDLSFRPFAQEIPTGLARIFAPDNESFEIDGVDGRVDADIAIIDTGIDRQHSDLAVVRRTDCTANRPLAEEAPVECLDDAGTDLLGHGTHVAGIAAAIDNGQGVVGAAPGARLWAVKVIDDTGFGSASQVIAGVDWVTSHADEIEVANMSVGCPCESTALDQAIVNSVAKGVVYAVAAGNFGMDASYFSPANHPDVITVSALTDFDGRPGSQGASGCLSDQDDTLAFFSNFGAAVDVVAPGTCIRSTSPGGAYKTSNGTSMAAPYVAGAAAVLASANKPTDKRGIEALRDQIASLGNNGWLDDSGDGVQEPLLDVHDAGIFAPKALAGPFNALPIARFARHCDAKLRCTFDASPSYDRDGRLVRYAWNLIGERKRKEAVTTGATVSHRFRRSGTYAVTLTVTDNRGATGKDTALVTVSDEKQRLAGPVCADPTDSKCEKWVASYDNPNGYGGPNLPGARGTDGPSGVAVSPSGDRIFVTGVSADNQGLNPPYAHDSTTVAYSRSGKQLWVAPYRGPRDLGDAGERIAVSADGKRVYVSGLQNSRNAEDPSEWEGDTLTVAYDADSGRQRWAARFEGSAMVEDVADMSVSPDGRRVFVTGWRQVPGCRTELFPGAFVPCLTYLTIAYDGLTGRQLWADSFASGSTPFDEGRSSRMSPDGRRLYVTGSTRDFSTYRDVSTTVAYDAASGSRIWVNSQDEPSFSPLLAISPDGSRIYVTNQAFFARSVRTTAYDAADGHEVWRADDLDHSGRLSHRAVSVNPQDGSLYVLGTVLEFLPDFRLDVDAVLLAYNPASGQKGWEQRYEGLDAPAAETFTQEYLSALVVDKSGRHIYIAGMGAGSDLEHMDATTVAYDAAGKQRWVARYKPSREPASRAFFGGAASLSRDGTSLYVTGSFFDFTNEANMHNYGVLAYDTSRGADR